MSIGRFDQERSRTFPVATAAILAAAAFGFAIGYDPIYGGAALAVCSGTGIIVFAPRFSFLLMLFLATGWPYFVGIPIGRDVPIPFMVPIICATFASVVVRQLLGLGPPEPGDVRMRLIDIGVAALMAALIISIVVNGIPEDSLKALLRVAVLPLLLYWSCRFFVRDAATTRAGFNALLLGSCVGSAYAVYEWFAAYNPLLETFAPPVGDLAQHGYWTATLANFQGLYRSHGFGMNPIFFGATSSMMLVYAAARLATAETVAVRVIFLILGAVCASGLVVTFSRGPILACAGGIFLLALGYKSLRIYVIVATVAAGILVSYNLLSESSVLRERLQENDNVTLRLKLWETAFAMFSDHPMFGVGLNSFPQHQIETIRRHYIGPFFEMGDGRLEVVKTAEHAFLQYMAETGLVGAAAAAFLIAAIARIYVPALFRACSEPARMLVTTAGTGIVVFFVIGLTVTIYNSWETAVVVPFFLAALINVGSLRPFVDRYGSSQRSEVAN
jgi:O-antigen ligase